MKLKPILPGTLFYFNNDSTLLIGHATPYIRPTNNDGGIGWDWEKDYGLFEIKKIEFYEIPGNPPIDFRQL